MNDADLEKRVNQAIYKLANEKNYICSVDVLLETGLLTKADYENWRFGCVDYLERVIKTNLRKMSIVNHLIRSYAAKNNFKPSWTAYHKWGKGNSTKLFFSKSRNANIEKNYATHYVKISKIENTKIESSE